jgi:hypothetical protein
MTKGDESLSSTQGAGLMSVTENPNYWENSALNPGYLPRNAFSRNIISQPTMKSGSWGRYVLEFSQSY